MGSPVVDIPVVGSEFGVPRLNPEPLEPSGIFLTYPFVIAVSKGKPYSTRVELAEHSMSEPQFVGHFAACLLPTQATLAAAKDLGFESGGKALAAALDCNLLASCWAS